MIHSEKYPHLTLYISVQSAKPGITARRRFLEKAVDILTVIVSGVGFIVAMFFLVTL